MWQQTELSLLTAQDKQQLQPLEPQSVMQFHWQSL
jgi:hypothetical protein